MRTEMSIVHDGINWVAKNDDMEIAAPTLEELDILLKTTMKEKGLIKYGERADVYMYSNNAVMIPQWMRPYSQHYFNRIVRITG